MADYIPNCGSCSGTGQMRCPMCLGARGQNIGPGGATGTWQWVPCGRCLGTGEVKCDGMFGKPHQTS
jgi:hypothetical protein